MHYSDLENIVENQRLDFASKSPGLTRQVFLAGHLTSPAVSVILGVRRCGKSTLLKQIAVSIKTENIFYLTLDDPRLVSFKATDFETVYAIWLKNQGPSKATAVLFLDEVQEVEGWEKWVNFFAEAKGHKVFITGSNSKLLSSELATYLTGRHLDVYLTPLSFSEIVSGITDLNPHSHGVENRSRLEQLFEKYCQYGGFPRCVLDESLSYLPIYYSDIVQRDIIVRGKIRNKAAMVDFARIVASETSRLVNHSKIARLLKLKDEATVRKFGRFLVQSYLFYDIRAFAKSIRVQNRSLPKYYCVDHAMAQANGFWKVTDATRVLELVVCAELKRRSHEVFYWKSQKNYEVDFIVSKGNTAEVAVQVCYAMNDPATEERELRALDAAFSELRVKNLVIITRHETKTITRRNYSVRVISILDFLLKNTEGLSEPRV
jgi:uncharacterized protein